MAHADHLARLQKHRAWFEANRHRLAGGHMIAARGDGPYSCPCCGELTLPERGGYDICPVCTWEDDGQDEHDADIVRGGPNGDLSLADARGQFGA